jgi:DNA-binding NarL/FixJ family response regulator
MTPADTDRTSAAASATPCVVIADDHPMVRDALRRTLLGVVPEAEVLEASDYATTVQVLQRCQQREPPGPRLALVDLHMPGMDRVEGLRRLRLQFPHVPLVVASGEDDPAVVRATLAAGAVGFLPKSETAEVLQQALRLLLGGGTYMPALALADLRHGAPPPRPDASGLTPRQMDVLRCLMRGQPNKLIARELGLTEGTVKIHIAAILRVLQARNRTEAVVVARNLGLHD